MPAYLVIGDLLGEKKIEKANEQGVQILSLDEYEQSEEFIKINNMLIIKL